MDETVVSKARAKIIWGEPAVDVLTYLKSAGIGEVAAQAILSDLLQERFQEIRRRGVRRIAIGALCVSVPVGYYFASMQLGFVSLQLFGLFLAVGFYGFWTAGTGLFMLLKSKEVSTDLSGDET